MILLQNKQADYNKNNLNSYKIHVSVSQNQMLQLKDFFVFVYLLFPFVVFSISDWVKMKEFLQYLKLQEYNTRGRINKLLTVFLSLCSTVFKMYSLVFLCTQICYYAIFVVGFCPLLFLITQLLFFPHVWCFNNFVYDLQKFDSDLSRFGSVCVCSVYSCLNSGFRG